MFNRLTIACPPTRKNKYNSDFIHLIYDKAEMEEIVVNLRGVNTMFDGIRSKGYTDSINLGYTAHDGKLHFNHCVDMQGRYVDADSSTCGLAALIASTDIDQLKILAYKLKSKGVIAAYYSPLLTEWYFP